MGTVVGYRDLVAAMLYLSSKRRELSDLIIFFQAEEEDEGEVECTYSLTPQLKRKRENYAHLAISIHIYTSIPTTTGLLLFS